MTEKEMMDEALEWQKHIRTLCSCTDDELYQKRSKIFDWLLKQAERAKELEEDIKKIIKTADVIDERNQRYIKALEKIVNQAGINKEIDLELWKMAREALEERK